MRPSDTLAGIPLSSDQLSELYLVEVIAGGRLFHQDVIDGFAEFETNPLRVAQAAGAHEALVQRWNTNNLETPSRP